MAIRLIALDLDGTLLNSHSEISPANRQALVAACERGVHIAVATGRRSHSARKYTEQLPCPVTLISSNGALTTSPSGEALYRDFLSPSLAREVLAATRDFRAYAAALFHLPARGQIVLQEGAVAEGPLGWYLTQSSQFIQLVPDLEAALGGELIQILFGGPPATVELVEPLLRAAAFSGRVHLSWTKYLTRNVSLLDVMNHGCTKGAALARLARHYGILPGEVMAIGDNHNDCEMLQYAAVPVLMANSSPGLESNGWHATLTNDQDGVAAAIHSHVLN